MKRWNAKMRWLPFLLAVFLLASCGTHTPAETSSLPEASLTESSETAESEESSLPQDSSEEPEEPEAPQPEEPAEPEELWIDAPTQAAQVNYSAEGKYGSVLTTPQEKQAFFQKYASSALYGGEPNLDDHYDQAFFADHKLVAAYVPVGSGSYRLEVESVWLKNGGVELNFNILTTGMGTCDMAGWVLLAELPADAPVTAETAVELKGYTVYYYSQAAGAFEDSEALLLDSRERLDSFVERYCPEGFLPDYVRDPLENVDFEKTCFIGVYISPEDAPANAAFDGLTRKDTEVEVHFRYYSVMNPAAEGRVFLLEISGDHPAVSGEGFSVKLTLVDAPLVFPAIIVTPPSPMQWTWIQQPEHQVAEVSLQNPPEAPVVIDTAEEKDAFLEQYGCSDCGLADRYDRAFFEENTLIVVYQMETSSPINTTLERVVIRSDGIVEVVFERRESGPWDAIAQRLYFIEIPKEYELSAGDNVNVIFQAFPLDE